MYGCSEQLFSAHIAVALTKRALSPPLQPFIMSYRDRGAGGGGGGGYRGGDERGFVRERPERRVSIMVRNLPKSIRWASCSTIIAPLPFPGLQADVLTASPCSPDDLKYYAGEQQRLGSPWLVCCIRPCSAVCKAATDAHPYTCCLLRRKVRPCEGRLPPQGLLLWVGCSCLLGVVGSGGGRLELR